MTFPKEHRAKLHSTNPIEHLNGEIKRRTDVVGIFPNDDAILRLVGALLLEQNDEWAVQRARYMTLVWGLRSQEACIIVFIPLFGRGEPFLRPGLVFSPARRAGAVKEARQGIAQQREASLMAPSAVLESRAEAGRGGSEAEPVCGAHMVRCNLVFGGPWAAQNMMQSSASTTRLRAAVPIWKAVLEPRHVTSTRHLGLADRQAELFACLSATRLPLPWYRVGLVRRQEAPLSSPSAAARSAACGRVPRSSPFACGPVR